MTFNFKQTSQDFFVSEKLPFELSWQGDAFYVYIQKRNITTHDIIDHLRSELGITRMSLGIAGLKDKRAIAKQRISIYDRALNKAWGEKVFLKTLQQIVKIVETGRHEFPLNMSTPISNAFHITFTADKKLWQEEKKKAQEIVSWLLEDGYPNLFGAQRFGINGRNSKQWYEIISWKWTQKFNKTDSIFKIQAYSSKLFNDFVKQRAKKWLVLMDGDIVTRTKWANTIYATYQESDHTVHEIDIKSDRNSSRFVPETTWVHHPYDPESMVVTGPVPWRNCAIPDPKTDAGLREQSFWQRHHLDDQMLKKFKAYPVYWLRRGIRVHPTQAGVWYTWDDLQVQFSLPSGSYASIVFDSLIQELS